MCAAHGRWNMGVGTRNRGAPGGAGGRCCWPQSVHWASRAVAQDKIVVSLVARLCRAASASRSYAHLVAEGAGAVLICSRRLYRVVALHVSRRYKRSALSWSNGKQLASAGHRDVEDVHDEMLAGLWTGNRVAMLTTMLTTSLMRLTM